eukprot:scaffold302586_cov83-Attheya_sp.AAC.1
MFRDTARKFIDMDRATNLCQKHIKRILLIPPTDLTVHEIVEIYRDKPTRGYRGKATAKYQWPFGPFRRPNTTALIKSEFLDNPNLIIANYLWKIEKDGAIFESDDRMIPEAGNCLQLTSKLKRTSTRITCGGQIKISMSQLSGAAHSIIHGYFDSVPNTDISITDRKSVRSGCHLCLEPMCIRHVMIAAQTVNLANDKCPGNRRCHCDELETNYGKWKCQFKEREII